MTEGTPTYASTYARTITLTIASPFEIPMINPSNSHNSNSLKILSEAEIINRVIQGEKEAYHVIVTRYMRRAYYIALGFVQNHQDALDMSQEAFIRAFHKLKRFDIHKPFFPWFYEILKNRCLDHIKKKKQQMEVPLEEMQIRQAEGLDRETKETIWRGIQSLPLDQREIILLRYFQQLSYREIADLTGKPLGTVMSSLYYAKVHLKGILQKFMRVKKQGEG